MFSDMLSDAAEVDGGAWLYSYDPPPVPSSHDHAWNTSYVRIKKKYEDAGYDMPRLIF